MKLHNTLLSFLFIFAALFSVTVGTVSAQGVSVAPISAACFSPVMNIRYGANDASTQGAVTSLQRFLGEQGYFNSAYIGSGPFGPLTLKAVVAFQSANGLPSTGYVGPLTRAVITKHCAITQTSVSLIATPTSGTAPLSVSFSGTGLTGGNQYIVDYGDGSNSGPLSAVNICMVTLTNPAGCPRVRAEHVYSTSGTYIATLENYIGCMWSNPRCMIATVPLGNATVVVGASDQHPLSVNGLDAPTTLSIGQQGTWTVHALTNNTSENLHYSVIWGDEQSMASSIMAPQTTTMNTSATFTHVYQYAGNHTVVFTVTNDYGATATISSTITVFPHY